MGHAFLFGTWLPMLERVPGEPDWHTDPLDKASWPRNRSTDRIDVRGPGRPGDVKLVWEPSRFYHLFDLCVGERNAVIAATHMMSWIEQNPWMVGVHWDNALDVALRAISWTAADARLARLGMPAWMKVRQPIVSALRWHGKFIESHLSFGAYNHLIGDAAGLAVLGMSYPQLPEARRWRARGCQILSHEIGRQILSDGSHAEQAPAYARFVADLYLLVGHVAGGHHTDDGRSFWQAAERLLEALMHQATPSCGVPGYGDDDGAMVLWTCPARHRLGISLAFGAAISGRCDFKYVSALSGCTNRAREVIATVLGPEMLDGFDAIESTPPVNTSVLLEDAGVAVNRSGWNAGSRWLLFKCGRMGVDKAAHGHADNLQILWQKPGWPVLVDPGTPTYNGDQALREDAVATATHNTVCIDGCSQAERKSRFAWKTLGHGERLEIKTAENRWRAKGMIRYWVNGRSVTHERCVEVSNGTIVVCDFVSCSGHHRVTLGLLFAGTLRWCGLRNRVTGSEGDYLDVSYSGWTCVRMESATTSSVYGRREVATRQVFSADMTDTFEGRIVCSRED